MRRLAMAGLWVLVVTAVASLTWFVIGRAGREVGVAQVALPAGSTVVATSAAPSPSTRAKPSPTESDEPTPTRRPSTPPPPRHTSSPSTPKPQPTVSAPATVRATFSTNGGTVTASCTGSTVKLVSATPRDGYRLHEQVDGGVLEVSFTSGFGEGDGDNEAVELHIGCQAGAPVEYH